MIMVRHRSPAPVVVGLTTGPASRAALDWAADYARAVGAPLRAVHALSAAEQETMFAVAGLAPPHSGRAGQRVTTPSAAERSRTEIETAYLAVTPEPEWQLVFGWLPVSRLLVTESEGARLLVLGGRSEHHAPATFRLRSLGPIAQYCLTRARCPVVTFPDPDCAEPERAVRPDAAVTS